MANLFTSSVTYGYKDSLEAFMKPMVIGKDIYTQAGIRIIPNVQSKLNLQLFGSKDKVLKAYTARFSGSTGVAHTTKTLQVYPMKAEFAQDAFQFTQTAYETILGKGPEWNDLDSAAQLKQIIQTVFMNGVSADIFRQFWLGDTLKETISSGVFTGVADEDYNAYDGVWKQLIAIASASPTAGTNIKRVALAHGSVAQVTTLSSITFPTAGGDIIVRVNGKNYSATYSNDLETTITAFVTANAAALLLRGIMLTGTSTTIVFTSAIAGQPFGVITIPSASDTLTCTVTATTPNTAPTALTTDEAYTAFYAMWTTCNQSLQMVPSSEKVIMCTYDMYYNYFQTLHESGKYTELAKKMIINGMEALSFQGIPVIPMEWDPYLATDFPTAYPSRAILAAKDQIILGLDTTDENMMTEFWYNKDEQQNRFRMQFQLGALIMHPDLICVAY